MKVLLVLSILTISVWGHPRLPHPFFNLESSYIIGGEESAKGSWPWQLSLEYYNEDLAEWRHTCGASLLDESHALTAAHCTATRFPRLDFRVVLGQFDRSVPDYEEAIAVVDVRQHEDFSVADGYPNDIAVLYLEHAAEFNEYVQPGAIPPFGQEWPELDCMATGWGLTHWDDADVPDKLQEVPLKPLTTLECQEQMPGPEGGIVKDAQLCGNDHDEAGEKGCCSGDSGGPLNCQHEGVWYIAGATSWGINTPQASCDPRYPTVFTRVSHYYDWIMESIEGNYKR